MLSAPPTWGGSYCGRITAGMEPSHQKSPRSDPGALFCVFGLITEPPVVCFRGPDLRCEP
jgi:hypothetical protein